MVDKEHIEEQFDEPEPKFKRPGDDGEESNEFLLMAENSPLVEKKKGTMSNAAKDMVELFMTFNSEATHAMAQAGMPLRKIRSYSAMVSDIQYAVMGGTDPRSDAAIIMAGYHGADRHAFNTAARVAGAMAESAPSHNKQGLLAALFGKNKPGGPTEA